MILVILAFQSSLGVVHAFSGDQLSAPLLSNPVTIDGKFTTSNEWADALQVSMSSSCSGCSGKALLYMKHDSANFYFLEDFLSDTSLTSVSNGLGDSASVSIDSAHDGGSVTGSDDVRFDSSYSHGGFMAYGIGGSAFSWNNALPAGVQIAMSLSNSPNSAVPHVIAEFQIPFSVFPKLPNTVGFSAAAYVCGQNSCGQLVIWPANYDRDIPSTWGELTVSPTPIPEFRNFWLMVIIPLLMIPLVRTKSK